MRRSSVYALHLVVWPLHDYGRLCASYVRNVALHCWAEAHVKIARMSLTIKLDTNWSSFQIANSAPPTSVTDSAIAPSARMALDRRTAKLLCLRKQSVCFSDLATVDATVCSQNQTLELGSEDPSKIEEVTLMRPIHGNL